MKLGRAVGFLVLGLAALVAAISPAYAHNKTKVGAPALFPVLNCTTTNGSNMVSTAGGNNFNSVQCGDNITGPGIPLGAFVSSANPIAGTSITISAPAGVGAGNGACNFTGTRVTNTMRFNIENLLNPGPCGPYDDEILGPCNGYQVVHRCVGLIDPANNYATGRAIYDLATNTPSNPCWTYGTARLGGENQIETLPDSVVACVGLYQPPGGTALGSHPDSTLRVSIGRSGTTVSLTIPTIVVGGQSVGSGGMQVRAAIFRSLAARVGLTPTSMTFRRRPIAAAACSALSSCSR
jgi:hypothetical protein